MGYSVDLRKISIYKYKEILEDQYLLLSKKILHQNVDSNFCIDFARIIKSIEGGIVYILGG